MMKCLTLNCQGFSTPEKKDAILDLILRLEVDIVFLQELNVNKVGNFDPFPGWGSFVLAPFCGKTGGVAIGFGGNLLIDIVDILKTANGDFLRIDVNCQGSRFRLINIYSPSGSEKRWERNEFFESLDGLVGGTNSLTIMGGDFNCVLKPEDTTNSSKSVLESGCLSEIVSSRGFIDAWDHLNLGKKGFTRKDPVSKKESRLDRFYVSSRLKVKLISTEVVPFPSSDHDALVLEIGNHTIERTQTLWKMNSKLVKTSSFKTEFPRLWENCLQQKYRFEEVGKWWDWTKGNIQAYMKQLGKEEAEGQRARFQMGEMRMHFLLRKRSKTPEEEKEMVELKLELKKEREDKVHGTACRAKMQGIEAGMNPSYSQLFEMEKGRANGSKITKITHNNKTMDTQESIADAFRDSFSRTFMAAPTSETDALRLVEGIDKEIDKTSRERLEIAFTSKEFLEVIKQMENRKSPGSDGLPKEFYEEAWPTIGETFTEIAEELLERGSFSESQNFAVITLIPKETGNFPGVNDFRPISLMNCDYKIISKAIANRLKPVLDQVIGEHQFCGIPGRKITDATVLIRDLLSYTGRKNTPGALVQLDFASAFDRCDPDFLHEVLVKMGFGTTFCKWIRAVTSGNVSAISVNKILGKPFPVTRGIRQGCGLSMLLFILHIEPLLCLIERTKEIEGLRLPGTETPLKSVGYADDVTIVVTTENDVKYALRAVAVYEAGTGAELKKEKCAIMGFGRWKGRKIWQIPWIKPVNSIKILGLLFTTLWTLMVRQNWIQVIRKLRATTNSLTNFRLNSFQKGAMLNLYGGAIIGYTAAVFPLNKFYEKKIGQILTGFIWGTSPSLVSREVLSNKIENGGIGLIALKAKCNAFLMRPFIEILSRPKSLRYGLAMYWTGIPLRDLFGREDLNLTPHFGGRIPWLSNICGEIISISKNPGFQKLKNKQIYGLLRQIFKTNIERKKGHERNYDQSWTSLLLLPKYSKEMDIAWRLIHEILPIGERGYGLHFGRLSQCKFCRDTETMSHFFATCQETSAIPWINLITFLEKETNQKLIHLDIDNLIRLQIPDVPERGKIIGKIARYIDMIWKIRRLQDGRGENPMRKMMEGLNLGILAN